MFKNRDEAEIEKAIGQMKKDRADTSKKLQNLVFENYPLVIDVSKTMAGACCWHRRSSPPSYM